ncbi:MAG TPA: 50S ribosomal protein L19 [Deltaproteobacteria bacterium]|nr:50S ribosomal protein L19 [Deltaproteobacteria bacterium]HCP45942.1 50S ribosomal protein L19 [Deltaproteobacteria bacterium]
MSKIIQQLEAEGMADARVPKFRAGETVRVRVRIKEGAKERIQVFEGVIISWKNAGLRSTMTVRKVSYGVGVERIFPIYSPAIERIEWVRRGRVRRAKLYYLRDLRGKKARLTEDHRAVAPTAS